MGRIAGQANASPALPHDIYTWVHCKTLLPYLHFTELRMNYYKLMQKQRTALRHLVRCRTTNGQLGYRKSNYPTNTTSSSNSLKSKWVGGDALYGVSPVLTALEVQRRLVHALYVQQGMDFNKRKDKAAIISIKKKAQEMNIDIVEASKHDLNMVTDNRPHQGFVLDCSPLEFTALDAMPEARSPRDVWLCLDEVTDPMNFGAALRSAYFLGAAGVLTCSRNSAPLTGVVSKASSGAMEAMPVHSCRSLLSTLADAKNKGWNVVGASAEEGALNCNEWQSGSRPTILVMGSEGYGLRTTVKRLCDALLEIEGLDRAKDSNFAESAQSRKYVDSLNVSVATGILLHRLLSNK